MRLSVFLLIVSLFQATAIGLSQNTTVNIDAQSISLEQLFAEIEKQANVKFLYRYENIAGKTAQVHAENMSVLSVLNLALKPNELKYTLMDNNLIVVAPTEVKQIGVSGKVVDASGEPMIGVNVIIAGTTTGTVTDIDGKFSISVPDANAKLVFSFIGFVSQEVLVGNQRTIQITLQEDLTELDEVVVVGYGTVRKKDLTGSVASVAMTDVARQPVIRVEDALKGKAAGVQITKQNAAPGAGMKIRIRGTNSVNGSNDPLYVIDGFVGGDFKSLNPNDIETINVLKDASATSLYGSRGSNGVVLVTTKQAKEGESKIEYNGFLSFDRIAKKMDIVSAAQYMDLVNQRQDYLGQSRYFTDANIAPYRNGTGDEWDWQDEITRTGITQNHQLSASGGTSKLRYFLSGSYLSQEGIMKNTDYTKYGLRSNINSAVGKRVDLAFNFYGTYTESMNNDVYEGRNGAMGSALIWPKFVPVMDPTYNDYSLSPAGYGPITTNPVQSVDLLHLPKRAILTQSSLQLNWRIIDGLKLSVMGGAVLGADNSARFRRYAPTASVASSEASHWFDMHWTYQNTNMLTYEKTLGLHRFDVSAIYEQQKYVSRGAFAYATGFATIALRENGLQLGSSPMVNSSYTEWALQSYMGRLNYSLMDKYLLTVSFRADGSSKFAPGNKYSYFPSAALGWRISEEDFIRNLDIFQNLKLRLSYGEVGSQAIAPYTTLPKMALERDYIFNKTKYIGIGVGAAYNPDLKWETTAQTNVGLDFGIFKGRLNGSIDLYYKKTKDLLFNVSIPAYNGGGSRLENIGSMENKGLEIFLEGIVIDRNDFQISTSVNVSMNRNKVLNMGEEEELFVNWSYNSSAYNGYAMLQKGKPMGQFRGAIFDGVWKTSEAAEAAKFTRVPGEYKYKNLVSSGGNKEVIDGNDYTVIGNGLPKLIWGWNTNIMYKNWDLNLYFNAIHGNDVWNLTRHLLMGMGRDSQIPLLRDEVARMWSPSNENTDIGGFSNNYDNSLRQSSQYIEKGGFIRLSNVTLGYTFSNLIRNTFVEQAKVYISAQNLFVLTNYSGFDPESSITNDNMDTIQGLDNACYPPTRTFIIGVKFAF